VPPGAAFFVSAAAGKSPLRYNAAGRPGETNQSLKLQNEFYQLRAHPLETPTK
jgi:hypothetical protein